MLVFSHIPKTGGTSFLHSLSEYYQSRLLTDFSYFTPEKNSEWLKQFLLRYQPRTYKPNQASLTKQLISAITLRELPRKASHGYWLRKWLYVNATRRRLRADIEYMTSNFDIIFGHFYVEKYSILFPHAQTAAFYRDPINQLISYYHHHRRLPPKPPAPPGYKDNPAYSFHSGIKNPSFMDFVKNPNVSRLYARLPQYPPRLLNFVGITEDYQLSIDLFNKIFSAGLKQYSDNVNPVRQSYDLKDYCDAADIPRVHELLAKNFKAYDDARIRFELLCNTYLR